ncbi:MAG: type IV pilus twitching motility protein PilT [Candidatus Omnitrophota bacterium]
MGQTLRMFLEQTVSRKGSGLLFGEGTCPAMRIDNDLEFVSNAPFSREEVVRMVREYLPEERFKAFEKERELDFSFGIPGVGRFRANLFYQRANIGCVIRVLPHEVMSFAQIGFPEDVAVPLLSKPTGLILVTGPTGCGKTTTLATMIDYLNQHESYHIVTIEDPIEYVYQNSRSMINQREVGSDTQSFSSALKHALRQDPDVILIGEMRDLESMEIALLAAETGHLIFATLHTPDASQSIHRIVHAFPTLQQNQVRLQLSFVLQAVISQQLASKVGGGRTLVTEILLATPAIRNIIRDDRMHQIYSTMQMDQKEGMRTFNMCLEELARKGTITREEALSRSMDVLELDRALNLQRIAKPKAGLFKR